MVRKTVNRRTLLKLLALAGLAGTGGFAARRAIGGNIYYSGPISDHFDGTRFFNPDGEEPRGFVDFLRWQFGNGKTNWPRRYESPFPAAKPTTTVQRDGLRITMIGHATTLVQTTGLNLLFDPVWADRTSPISFLGPKRVNEPGIAFADLPPIHAVLVSHNHYDHLDLNTLARLADAHEATFYTPLGNDTILAEAITNERIVSGDWGDTISLTDKVRLYFEPVHHWSARGSHDRRMALWSGFVLDTPAGKIYHIGDTGFHDGINYRAAAERHGRFRLAILPIGAYEPRWFMRDQHQDPDEAVRGHQLCKAHYTAGHHWGTFQLTNEAIDAPIRALAEARVRHGVSDEAFRALRPGESWDVPTINTLGE